METIKILAVDPGTTTGIAIAEFRALDARAPGRTGSLRLIRTLSVPISDEKALATALQQCQQVSVIERSPALLNFNAAAFDRCFFLLPSPSIIVYSPGDWKPVARKRQWKSPIGGDQHQKDAMNMLRYHIFKTYESLADWNH